MSTDVGAFERDSAVAKMLKTVSVVEGHLKVASQIILGKGESEAYNQDSLEDWNYYNSDSDSGL